MRTRISLLIILGVLLLRPMSVQAQQIYTLQLAYISVWPEYEYSVDKPGQLNVLVINRFVFDPQNMQFPAQIRFQIPATALKPSVVAVGQTADSVSDQNVQYTTSQPNNGWIDVLVTATGPAIQLEYYDYNIAKTGNSREFMYVWPGTYAVGTFHIDVRVPMRATNMKSVPDATSSGTDADGFKFGEMTVPNIPAGKIFTLKINYDRDTDAPSTTFMQVQPSGALDQPVSGQVSLEAFMPWIIGGLAFLLVVGGAGWYTLSNRKDKNLVRARRRPAVRANSQKKDEQPGDRQVYCHECGKRAQAGDLFCRTCGTQLRQGGQ